MPPVAHDDTRHTAEERKTVTDAADGHALQEDDYFAECKPSAAFGHRRHMPSLISISRRGAKCALTKPAFH